MAETVTMPKLGFDMAEGTLVRWLKLENEQVNKGDVLAEIETDKATVEVESSYSGILAHLLVEQGDIVPVGMPIAIIAAPGEKIDPLPESTRKPPKILKNELNPQKSVPIKAKVPEIAISTGVFKVSPLARRIAAELGVDLHFINGTGPDGRIIRRDVEAGSKKILGISDSSRTTMPVAATKKPAPAIDEFASSSLVNWKSVPIPADQIIPMDKLRATIGRRMLESKQQIPHFFVTYDYDVESLLELRKQINTFLPQESRLSVNDFLVKATALNLRQFPNLNASLRNNAIIRHGHIHLGIAVAVSGGLMTVVCRDADQKSLQTISTEVRELATRARSGKVRPEDIEGSTFSISNLGMYGLENFAAIINPPEAAILAVSGALQVPVVRNGIISVGTKMKITLSADHRVTDGAEAAQFLQSLAVYLENPAGLLFEKLA